MEEFKGVSIAIQKDCLEEKKETLFSFLSDIDIPEGWEELFFEDLEKKLERKIERNLLEYKYLAEKKEALFSFLSDIDIPEGWAELFFKDVEKRIEKKLLNNQMNCKVAIHADRHAGFINKCSIDIKRRMITMRCSPNDLNMACDALVANIEETNEAYKEMLQANAMRTN